MKSFLHATIVSKKILNQVGVGSAVSILFKTSLSAAAINTYSSATQLLTTESREGPDGVVEFFAKKHAVKVGYKDGMFNG